MKNEKYFEGVRISRNFNKRNVEETQYLYAVIQEAATLILTELTTNNADDALEFLTTLYEPLLKKVAYKVVLQSSGSIEFDDALQEANLFFLTLLYDYDDTIASFSYYINSMLKKKMNRWMVKECNYHSKTYLSNFEDRVLADPMYTTKDDAFVQFNSYVVIREYFDYMQHRAERPSRSGTVQEVCYRYFLGGNSCSYIAQDLGISYHAVYEIIQKIKRELQEFFNENKFCNFVISSTGIEVLEDV
jgi:RNA polymerase sigma factor (sigma-70 family)